MNKYCGNCGSQMDSDAEFCSECGKPVNSSQNTTNHETSKQSVSQTPNPKQPMSKKTKIMLIAGIAAVVLLFAGHKMIESIMSEDRLIENFSEALHEQDAKKVASMLTSNDKKLDINEKTVSGLMKYYKENPDQVNETVKMLERQASALDKEKDNKNKSILDGIVDMFGSSMVSLSKDGKFLFYDKFSLKVEPIYLSLQTNYKDTVLYIDGKEVGKADEPNFEGVFGPVLPGYHSVKAVLKNDYLELNSEEEVTLRGMSSKETVYLHLEAQELTISVPNSDEENAVTKLFVNGKDVGVNVIENPTFGPVLTDGSMTFHVEAVLPWGTVTTAEQPIENRHVSVRYDSAEVKNTVMETVHSHLSEWIDAYTSGDVEKMTSTTADYKEAIGNNISDDKRLERAMKAQYLSSKFDLESFDLYFEEGTWRASIIAEDKWKRDTYYVGSDNIELREETEIKRYSLRYDTSAKKWIIEGTSRPWFYSFSDEEAKEYTVKDPKTYTSAWAK
ncbi:zinc ribbon domain-containing protein [Bacillus kwashiorkori]|uniref:zinc ribbon domain-containing protein n=1 Tax=Bacillus kwashiorkori TaxID=1522318 RepID=UPI000780DB60|nr:zinc-ribbon domain-containing protein [Bacillus kwashiorkori]